MSKKYKVYEYAIIRESAKICKGSIIGPFCYIGHNARIGKNCRILYFTRICKDVVIGDNVFIGPGTRFLNDKYPPSKVSNPPIIEDNVIIGASCIIMPKVTVHHGSLVGAGSIVNRDIPPEEVWYGYGNPAVFRMTRKDYEKQKKRKED